MMPYLCIYIEKKKDRKLEILGHKCWKVQIILLLNMYISTYIHVHTNNFPIRHPHTFFVFCRKYPKHHRSVMSRDTEQFQPLAHRIGILWPGVPARIDADFCPTQTFDELFVTRFAISHANRVRHFPVKFQHSTIYTIVYLDFLRFAEQSSSTT